MRQAPAIAFFSARLTPPAAAAPVDDPPVVRVRERARHIAEDAHRFARRHVSAVAEPRTKALAFDERHCVVRHTVRVARVEHRYDVRLLERRGHPDLALESRGAESSGQLGRGLSRRRGGRVAALRRRRRATCRRRPTRGRACTRYPNSIGVGRGGSLRGVTDRRRCGPSNLATVGPRLK